MVIIQPALNLYSPALFPERRLMSHWYSPHLAHLATKGNIYIKISKIWPQRNSLKDQMREKKMGRGKDLTKEERDRKSEAHWKYSRESKREKNFAAFFYCSAKWVCWVSFLAKWRPHSVDHVFAFLFLVFYMHLQRQAVYFWKVLINLLAIWGWKRIIKM